MSSFDAAKRTEENKIPSKDRHSELVDILHGLESTLLESNRKLHDENEKLRQEIDEIKCAVVLGINKNVKNILSINSSFIKANINGEEQIETSNSINVKLSVAEESPVNNNNKSKQPVIVVNENTETNEYCVLNANVTYACMEEITDKDLKIKKSSPIKVDIDERIKSIRRDHQTLHGTQKQTKCKTRK